MPTPDAAPPKLHPAAVLVALLMIGLVGAGIALVPSLFRADVRDFVRTHFAAVRQDPATFAGGARDAEMREAYAVVAASREEAVAFFTDAGSRGSPLDQVAPTWCVSVSVPGAAGTRKLGVVVTERSGVRGLEYTVQALSARRTCVCRKRLPCRFE